MTKNKVIHFIWQHIMLLISLYIMTLGVATCVRSMLGSSVISVLPYVFETAGKQLESIPSLTIGQYTYIMNFVLVFGQILVLRRQFELVQLFQLLIGFVFGSLIDLNMFLTQWLTPDTLILKALTQIAGCTILATGIALEVRCGSVTMPGEGFPVAISKVSGKEFPKVKIVVDCSLVALGVILSYIFFGAWQWQIVGIGTLFAMVYVGWIVKKESKHLGWFDKILAIKPIYYGLKKYYERFRNRNGE